MPPQSSRRRVVVITGASEGLGRATARAFAARGDSIGLIARGVEGLEATRREVESLGGRGLVLPLDIANADAVETAASIVESAFGPNDRSGFVASPAIVGGPGSAYWRS